MHNEDTNKSSFPGNESKHNNQQSEKEKNLLVSSIERDIRYNPNVALKNIINSSSDVQPLLIKKAKDIWGKERLKAKLLNFAIQTEKEDKTLVNLHLISKAYVLANRKFRAAQNYAFNDLIEEAIKVFSSNPDTFKDIEVSKLNLARIALQKKNYYIVSKLTFYLFNSKPIKDEIRAELTQATRNNDKKRIIALKSLLENINPKELIANGNKQAIELIKKGKLKESDNLLNSILKRTAHLPFIREKAEFQDLEFILENIVQKWLTARNQLNSRNKSVAQKTYTELLNMEQKYLDMLPSVAFAETALTFEDTNVDSAQKYYEMAANKAPTKAASERYLLRAKSLKIVVSEDKSNIESYKVKSEIKKGKEYCSVCQKPLLTEEGVERCPKCNSPAHGPHLREWLKVKSVCPVCRQHIELE